MSEPNSDAPEGKRTLRQWLRDAFSLEPDRRALTEEEIALLDRIAGFVVRKHLTVPAIMLLESVRPMNYLGSQTMAFFKPMWSILMPGRTFGDLQQILEKRQSIEILMQRIEKQEAEREPAPPGSTRPATDEGASESGPVGGDEGSESEQEVADLAAQSEADESR